MKKINTKYRETKTLFTILFLFILILAEWSCKDDDTSIEPDKNIKNEKTEIYYYNNNNKQVISANDTLSLKLESTLTIYIDSVNSPSIHAQTPIDIQNNNNFSYDCHAREVALSGVMVTWNNNTESMAFYIDILPLNAYFYVQGTNFIINVTDETVKEAIQDELIKNYIPNYSAIKLSYKTLSNGDLVFVYGSEESTNGTFNEDGENISLLCSDHSYTILYAEENSKNEYSITQDLTRKFKEQYATENIQEVLTVTTLLKSNN